MPVGTSVARAQSPDMVTDRPDQTESAAVVPRGLLQVETGYLFARDGDVDGYAAPGTLFRIGLGGRLELRIGHAGLVGGAGRHGAGDSELGAKINLIERADGWRPELALLGGLSPRYHPGRDITFKATFALCTIPAKSVSCSPP